MSLDYHLSNTENMFILVVTSLLQEVLAVAGVGECVFTQNKKVSAILTLNSNLSDLSNLYFPTTMC